MKKNPPLSQLYSRSQCSCPAEIKRVPRPGHLSCFFHIDAPDAHRGISQLAVPISDPPGTLPTCVYPSLVLALALSPLAAQAPKPSPFVGHWDFNLSVPDSPSRGAVWLGVTEKNGALEVWYQPTGGNVYQVKDFKAEAAHLTLTLSAATAKAPALTWALDANGNTLTGTQTRGDKSFPLHGVRAPALKRDPPNAWTTPEPLFNGKDLTGWEPIGNVANTHWTVKDGLLYNSERGANLRTTRTFTDFKFHFEVNCPDDANSGFYLRGRYELQLEYGPVASESARARHRLHLRPDCSEFSPLPRTPGMWETFDVTLVGRMVTDIRNGVAPSSTIRKSRASPAGPWTPTKASPGSFYIQGDHTGGLQFRNITVSVPGTEAQRISNDAWRSIAASCSSTPRTSA